MMMIKRLKLLINECKMLLS